MTTLYENLTNVHEKKTKQESRPDPVFQSTDAKVTDNKDHFPINSIGRARNALARIAQYDASPDWYKGPLKDLQKKVKAAVKKAFPSIEVNSEKK